MPFPTLLRHLPSRPAPRLGAALLRQSFLTLLDLLAPPVCAGCGAAASHQSPLACAACLSPPDPAPPPLAVPIAPDPTLDGAEWVDFAPPDGQSSTLVVLSAYPYEGPLAALIQELKYRRLEPLGQRLGRELAAIVTGHALRAESGRDDAAAAERAARLVTDGVTCVVPIPLHIARRRERGYNQSSLIARGYAAGHRLPPPRELLRRRRATRSQTHFDRERRWTNVADAFEAVAELPRERVLLVDDVITTGATLAAAAQALRRAGAELAGAVTIAQSEVHGARA